MKQIAIVFAFLSFATSNTHADTFCNNIFNQLMDENYKLGIIVTSDFEKINDKNLEVHQKDAAKADAIIKINNTEFPYSVTAKARGAFRFEECPLRPLTLELNYKDAEPFPFIKNFQKLKIVSPCDNDDRQRLLEIRKLYKEYLTYKFFNLFPGPSLKVKMIQLQYVNLQGQTIYSGPAFIQESEKNLANRCNMKVRNSIIKRWDNDSKKFKKYTLDKNKVLIPYLSRPDSHSRLRTEFFNLLIDNNDYDFESDHNIIPLASKDESNHLEYSVPYDFDLSTFSGGTYYSGTKNTIELAHDLKKWIKAQEDQVYAQLLKDTFINNATSLKSMILNSKLDTTGKNELILWINVFNDVLEK